LKAVNMGRPDKWELYDLSSDLSEEHDLSGKYPEKIGVLVREWERLDAEMAEPAFR
jgi:arylsulfatase A-like enzyme